MDNNKGFTLIELLVSIAIFGIVIAAVFGFMISGTRSYSHINSTVDLQTNSQLTMNFLEEYLIDCDEAFYNNDSDTIYIINKAAPDNIVYIFKYDNSQNSILFRQGKAQIQANGSYLCFDLGDTAVLSNMVSYFNVDHNLTGSGDNLEAVSVELHATFVNNSSEITSTKLIAFRNKPAFKPIA